MTDNRKETDAAQASGRPVIETRDLWFSYNGAWILEDVNIAIAPKDFACIVGPNGGGKTTLLKLLVGLLKPTRGEVRVFGTTPREARSLIGYMPQYLLFDPKFPVSVLDVVLMGCLGNGQPVGPYRKECKAGAREALERVGIADLAEKPYSDLSGGQRQRTLIARALSARPQMLLFDEPTASLDVEMERELYELLSRLNEQMTVVTVTHDLAFVSRYVKTAICVKRRVAVHPTQELCGADMGSMYGSGVKAVRHDVNSGEGGMQCPIS